MLRLVLDYQLDVIGFAGVLVGAAALVHVWLRGRHEAGLGPRTWALIGAIATNGAAAALWAGSLEQSRLREMLQGIAPTYAQELELMGHAAVTLDTPADDPAYLAMIAAQIRWTRANPSVADVYTFDQLADGSLVLVLDAETDYDRDGVFEDDREARTAIGEAYDEVTENMRLAFAGTASFDAEPYSDRWGTWVSAYVPMRDPKTGAVESILGVDYDASMWLGSIARSRAAALGFVALGAAIALAAAAVATVARVELARRVTAERERERLHGELLVASRKAGMAEVATGVLHNVGNVLNSVNVSAGVIAERLRRSKVPALGKVAGMLRERRADLGAFLSDDQKGKVIPDYLLQLSEMMNSDQGELLNELDRLGHSVEHIKQIVASQQAFARAGNVTETFPPADVVEDAVRINAAALERHGVRVVRDYGPCNAVTADRHKVMQILVNLISNAKDAMREKPDGERTVTIRLRETTAGSEAVARVEVIDTGTGVKREDVPSLFRHGFTTRADGHGFGLHFCANAAKEMKGSLTAHSDGPGRGATFTLEIPLEPREAVV